MAKFQFEWKLLIENCTGCGICRDVCTENAIKMTREMAYPEPVAGRCVGCLECFKQCPFDAIRVKKVQNDNYVLE